ncbi:MAG: polysaccharide deacetylase family protein [Cyclobacteriaceae bacterium]|nr:polysaccharide deacetylase family protein [Cyclobacteriaceae bacterium]
MFKLILAVLICVTPALAQKKVCFTIDDLPVVSYSISDSVFQRTLTNDLLNKLSEHQIPAIGFVNEFKLYTNDILNPFQVSLLKQWVDANLGLGNHTFSHLDYNNASLNTYGKEILKGELQTRKLLTARNKPLRYFRHPYLHAGDTKAKSDSLEQFLKAHQYIIAPVTIDNVDYLFALAYHRAYVKKDSVLMSRIGTDYLAYMEKMLHYYETLSVALFGRNIHHTLLLHANLLNAHYIGKLAEVYKHNGYAFISLGEALQDKAYETEITRFGKWGISWIDRWALSQGKGNDFFKGEPVVPDYISEMTK